MRCRGSDSPNAAQRGVRSQPFGWCKKRRIELKEDALQSIAVSRDVSGKYFKGCLLASSTLTGPRSRTPTISSWATTWTVGHTPWRQSCERRHPRRPRSPGFASFGARCSVLRARGEASPVVPLPGFGDRAAVRVRHRGLFGVPAVRLRGGAVGGLIQKDQ